MSIIRGKWNTSTSAPQPGEGRSGLGRSERVRERIASFAQDTAGDVAILFGLMTMAMFMLIGAAVDIGRWLNARDQTIAAIDSAVLAAGRTLQTNSGNQTEAIAMAQRYYAEAIKGRLALKSDTVSFSVVDNGTAVQATGNAEIRTPFMGLAGIRDLPLLKNTGAEHSKSILAVGGNAELNIEISMMLDTSGSMGEGSKMTDMKDAAKDLVNIVVWADQSQYKSRVALVPFSGDVRIPGAWYGQVTDPTWPSSRTKTSGSKNYTYNRASNCVSERTGSNKHTDVAAGPGNYVMNVYTSNGNCSQYSSDNEVVPLTNNKDLLLSKIGSLDLGGGTAGHIGTAWAYYMLSPNWAPLMATDNKPVAYSTPKTQKIAILMTDGEYNYTYDNTGVPTNSKGANGSANGNSSAGQAIATCNQMKQSGIEVYTVGFDLGDNQTAINTLKNCATDDSKAYSAANGEELKAAFRAIALKISQLYLVK
jgi:Flp pilus assembly protein TadG